MPGTARPGSLGNAVIAGHRTIAGAPFARLDDVRRGDRITVVTGLGSYTYRVIDVGTAQPGQKDPISPDRHPRLTLVTSGGTAASGGRSYVVAALTSTPNQAAVPHHPPTPAERGLSGDSNAVLPSVLWGMALAAVFAATFAAYWRFRRNAWSVYMLSTPIILAVALVWYENLIRLLPGTM
jgi:sortase A